MEVQELLMDLRGTWEGKMYRNSNLIEYIENQYFE